jgi:uncharacterized protein (TIGR02145 family)
MKTQLIIFISIMFITITTMAQVAINTDGSTPNGSALLDLKSNKLGLLFPRMTSAERDVIVTPADGLVIFNTTTGGLEYYYYGYWYRLPGIPDVPTVTNTVTGETWMDRNLGAERVAITSDDTAALGHLFQWGRANEGHENRDSDTTSTTATTPTANNGNPWDGKFILETNSPYDWLVIQIDTLWTGVDAFNNPCPDGFRIPTEAEWGAEQQSWTTNNAAGAFGSVLKLPLGGYRSRFSGTIYNSYTNGYYWSSTTSGINAYRLYITSSAASISEGNRAFGCSVRCIKE